MYEYRAVVTGVYDGDTITVNINLGLGVWKYKEKLRLKGIDAPELRGETREAGLVSRDFLRQLILNKEVQIVTFKDKKGKYGRYITDIYIGGYSVNELMLNNGMAVKYE